jgi:hypothetical protein
MVHALSRLDTGPPDTEIVIRVNGEVGQRYPVTMMTAAAVLDRVRHGWRLPPAVHWRWMHGLPILEELVGVWVEHARHEVSA